MGLKSMNEALIARFPLLAKIERYVKNVLVAKDQLANAFLGGDPDETLSGRMGKAIAKGKCALCRPICWLLGKLDKDHCAKAAQFEADEGENEVIRL